MADELSELKARYERLVAGWRLHWIVIAKCGGIRPFELQVATGQVVANWVIISGRC